MSWANGLHWAQSIEDPRQLGVCLADKGHVPIFNSVAGQGMQARGWGAKCSCSAPALGEISLHVLCIGWLRLCDEG